MAVSTMGYALLDGTATFQAEVLRRVQLFCPDLGQIWTHPGSVAGFVLLLPSVFADKTTRWKLLLLS